jgi:hypothetical protein
LGQYTQLAKTIISTDNHNTGGAPSKLTDDEIIKIKIDRDKGRTVPAILKTINAARPAGRKVGKDTIYRALKPKQVSQN